MKKTHREYDPNDVYEPLPHRLFELRKAAGNTQEEIGEKLGVSKSNYASYESGKTLPPIDKIITLAKYYNVSTDYLLGLSDAKTNDITEAAVCEYLSLDIDTVRSLHGNADKKLHVVIDFLFKERRLLNLITGYAWSILPQLIEFTDYKYLFYDETMSLEGDEKRYFSEVIFYLQDFNLRFKQMCKERIHEFDSIIKEYVMHYLDIETILWNLVDLGKEDVIRNLFASFDYQKLSFGSFMEALGDTDKEKYQAFIMKHPIKRHAWNTAKYIKSGTDEDEKFIKVASDVLDERTHQIDFLRSRRLYTSKPITDSRSNDGLKEEDHGDKKRENN